MGKADFTGFGIAATTDHSGVGDRVVGGSEWGREHGLGV